MVWNPELLKGERGEERRLRYSEAKKVKLKDEETGRRMYEAEIK